MQKYRPELRKHCQYNQTYLFFLGFLGIYTIYIWEPNHGNKYLKKLFIFEIVADDIAHPNIFGDLFAAGDGVVNMQRQKPTGPKAALSEIDG